MLPVLTRARSILPPKGQYELFNLSLLFYVVVLTNYLLVPPSGPSAAALSWLFGETPIMVWGIGLNICAIVGMVCSYRQAWLPLGYGAITLASSVWCGALAVGWFMGLTPGEPFVEAASLGAYGAAIMFGIVVTINVALRTRIANALLAGACAGAALCVFVTIVLLIGDPRTFTAIVLYGFICRQAAHEAREA